MEADDIAHNPHAIALQNVIAAAPHDHMSQLVLADLLQDAGDLRGELIALDLLERTTRIGDPETLLRYLLLAAEYSFPRALPDEPMLAFYGYGSQPPSFSTQHAGRHYTVTYRDRTLTVMREGHERLSCSLERVQSANSWTTDETHVILRLISDAIRAGTFLGSLRFPFMREAMPMYDGGPLRGYRLPKRLLARYKIAPDRYGLAPRDVKRWMTLWGRLP